MTTISSPERALTAGASLVQISEISLSTGSPRRMRPVWPPACFPGVSGSPSSSPLRSLNLFHFENIRHTLPVKPLSEPKHHPPAPLTTGRIPGSLQHFHALFVRALPVHPVDALPPIP